MYGWLKVLMIFVLGATFSAVTDLIFVPTGECVVGCFEVLLCE